MERPPENSIESQGLIDQSEVDQIVKNIVNIRKLGNEAIDTGLCVDESQVREQYLKEREESERILISDETARDSTEIALNVLSGFAAEFSYPSLITKGRVLFTESLPSFDGSESGAIANYLPSSGLIRVSYPKAKKASQGVYLYELSKNKSFAVAKKKSQGVLLGALVHEGLHLLTTRLWQSNPQRLNGASGVAEHQEGVNAATDVTYFSSLNEFLTEYFALTLLLEAGYGESVSIDSGYFHKDKDLFEVIKRLESVVGKKELRRIYIENDTEKLRRILENLNPNVHLPLSRFNALLAEVYDGGPGIGKRERKKKHRELVEMLELN